MSRRGFTIAFTPSGKPNVSAITGGAATAPNGPEAEITELTMGHTIPDLLESTWRQLDGTDCASPSPRLPKGGTGEDPHE